MTMGKSHVRGAASLALGNVPPYQSWPTYQHIHLLDLSWGKVSPAALQTWGLKHLVCKCARFSILRSCTITNTASISWRCRQRSCRSSVLCSNEIITITHKFAHWDISNFFYYLMRSSRLREVCKNEFSVTVNTCHEKFVNLSLK